MHRSHMTTAEVAATLGVGATTIKRWVTDGLLPEVRTPGGHRRFRRDDVETFLARCRAPSGEREADRWIRLLLGPVRLLEIHQAVLDLRAEASGWSAVGDFFGRVLDEVGRRWACGEMIVAEEHLISGRLMSMLSWCAASLPVPLEAPCAVLAAADGEDHTLGLSLSLPCFHERGWKVEFLGSLPTAELVERVRRGGMAVVGLSASAYSSDPDHLARQQEQLIPACRQAGAQLVLGGRGAWPDRHDHALRVRTLEELAPVLDHVAARTKDAGRARKRRAR